MAISPVKVFFHEKPEKIKHSLSDVWERTLKECAAHGKKTFALIENMLMPTEVIEEYAIGLENFFKLCSTRSPGVLLLRPQ